PVPGPATISSGPAAWVAASRCRSFRPWRIPPAIFDDYTTAMSAATRTESDSFGPIEVPADRYWGAQTQRSLHHFAIGDDVMPRELIHAFGVLKKAAVLVNLALGLFPEDKADLIAQVAAEIA